jgi:hypothetical protein
VYTRAYVKHIRESYQKASKTNIDHVKTDLGRLEQWLKYALENPIKTELMEESTAPLKYNVLLGISISVQKYVVQYLRFAKAIADYEDRLRVAASNDDTETVKGLLESDRALKATLSGLPELSEWAKKTKFILGSNYVDLKDALSVRTPLSLAAEKGYDKVVRELLESDRALKATLSRSSELSEWAEKTELMLGSNYVDLKDTSSGRTPLSLAAEKGHHKVVKELLKHPDVDRDTRDIHGQTPLSWAL